MSLENFGWEPFFSQQVDQNEATLTMGRVASQHHDLYRVFAEIGELVCNVSGRLRNQSPAAADLPAVGDWVLFRQRELARGTILRVLRRRSQLSRRAAGNRNEQQIIAANVDTVFIVTGLDHDFSLRRMERYLSLVLDSGAAPVLILNKCDLADDVEGKRLATESIAQSVAVHLVSAVKSETLAELNRYLSRGQTVALLGSSGVGKSTLINSILGTELQRTKTIRSSDSKGRHTTTYRRLIPLTGGAMLLDTPGMREVQLWAGEESLHRSFADIVEVAEGCRFRDCTHQHEPGCAVRGLIDDERLASFHKQQKELAYLHRQTNLQAAHAEKQRWKAIHKSMRNYHPHG